MSTPFERGRRQGQWTDKQIREAGFASARHCLAHQEKVYQEEIAKLSSLRQSNAQRAARQAEFLEGFISATRESLRGCL